MIDEFLRQSGKHIAKHSVNKIGKKAKKANRVIKGAFNPPSKWTLTFKGRKYSNGKMKRK
jgi:hypothetical protein